MKMNDYVGRHVKLRHRIETRGGDVFEAGEVLEVYGHWRGKLQLDRVAQTEEGLTSAIRHVAKREVDLLPKDPKSLVAQAVRSACELAGRYGLEIKIHTGPKGKVTPEGFVVVKPGAKKRAMEKVGKGPKLRPSEISNRMDGFPW